MKQYQIHINTGAANYNVMKYAKSPKEAAVQASYSIASQNGIKQTLDKINKSIEQKVFTGWSNWWGSLVEVVDTETGKKSSYALTCNIDNY